MRWGSESIVKLILRRAGTEASRVLDRFIQFLLERKFGKSLRSGDRLGRTPLHYAASQKTGLSYITNLLRAGANKDAQVSPKAGW